MFEPTAPRWGAALRGLAAAVFAIGSLVVASGPVSATPEPVDDHGAMHGGDHSVMHGEAGDASDDDHGAMHGEAGDAGHDDHGTTPDEGDEPTHDDHGAQDSHADEAGGHTQHGSGESTVTDATRVRVLGGFGAVNAAAVGGAFLLRRRDRGKGRQARDERGIRP